MDGITKSIVDMGFELDKVQKALKSCEDNQKRAIELLLSGDPLDASPSPLPLSSALIQTDISQYSLENGRSACTCIALTGAKLYLEHNRLEFNSDHLRNMIIQGVSAYQSLSRSRNIEHMSAEEVLNQKCPDFPLTIIGGVRQGILSADSSHPMSLKCLLQNCGENDNAKVVLITKTPETVVVCLDSFTLLDSHPRHFLNASNAYAKIHNDLNGLIRTLELVFPHTSFGADIPEMMAMMYNSFDLYPLKYRES